jgi:uncharacterized short protein YbdD (DUF466 family)
LKPGSLFAGAGAYLGEVGRLMVGVPEYDRYLAHMQATHPGAGAMSYAEFFRDRQEARFAGRAGKCC